MGAETAFRATNANATASADHDTTALGGVLVATVGAPTALWIDAGGHLVSAATLLLIRRPFRIEEPPAQRAGLRADIAEGLRFVRRHPADLAAHRDGVRAQLHRRWSEDRLPDDAYRATEPACRSEPTISGNQGAVQQFGSGHVSGIERGHVVP